MKIYITLIAVMLVWGLNVTAVKLLVQIFPPVTITAFRVLTAGIVMLLILWKTEGFIRLKWKEIGFVAIAGITGIFGHHYFLATGLSLTTASNAGLILGLVPLMTSVFAMIFLGERFTILRIIGVFLGLFGVAFIVLSNHSEAIGNATIGDVFVFFAVVTQAISFIFVKKATEVMSSLNVTSFMQLIGAFALLFLGVTTEPTGMSSLLEGNIGIWIVFLASAILATGVGGLFYNQATKQLGAGETAVFINLSPFFSLAGAVIFLNESVHLSQLFGFLLIVSGVVLGTGAFEKKRITKGQEHITGERV